MDGHCPKTADHHISGAHMYHKSVTQRLVVMGAALLLLIACASYYSPGKPGTPGHRGLLSTVRAAGPMNGPCEQLATACLFAKQCVVDPETKGCANGEVGLPCTKGSDGVTGPGPQYGGPTSTCKDTNTVPCNVIAYACVQATVGCESGSGCTCTKTLDPPQDAGVRNSCNGP